MRRSWLSLCRYYNAFNNTKASYDKAKGRLQLYDVQMSSLFVAESKALQKLAVAVGDTAAVAMLKQQCDNIGALINGVLWDEATGIYRQVDASNLSRGFSPAISPTSFYPLIAGVASTARAQRMVNGYLTNASEFCVRAKPKGMLAAADEARSGDASRAGDATGSSDAAVSEPGASQEDEGCPYAPPSISKSDPNYYDNSYWRGRIWGPLNLLLWMGLSEPTYAQIPAVQSARKGLCEQSSELLMKEWMAKRHVHENYNSTTGVGGDVPNSNPFYHWGANLVYIGMREAMQSGAGD